MTYKKLFLFFAGCAFSVFSCPYVLSGTLSEQDEGMWEGQEEDLFVGQEIASESFDQAQPTQPSAYIKGVLLKDKTSTGQDLEEMTGVHAVGVDVPGGIERLSKILTPLLPEGPLTKEDLLAIKRAIILYYRAHNRPVVDVEIPEQEITSGVLQVVITESTLGKVVAVGNKWTSSKTLVKGIEIQPGQVINEQILLSDVSFLNLNPFRHVDVLYTAGEAPDTTDIELITKDRFPLRIYAGGDNTGIKDIGRQRWFAGFNWGNAFGLDHVLSYQYTTASNIHEFQAHTVEYTAPLSWHDIFTAYGGYSHVRAHLPHPGRHSEGNSYQASARYTHPFLPLRYYLHELVGGFDFKRTNNTVEFSEGIPRFGKNVNLTQLMLGYNCGYERQKYRFSFDFEIYISPGSWIDDQAKEDFESLRPHAKPRYGYGRGSFSYSLQLPKDFFLSALVRGQGAVQNLLPSEQLGIGGYNTVRGYEERTVNADNGLILNVELRSPDLGLLKYMSKVKDELQFLVFMDYGYGHDHQKTPGIAQVNYLAGVGPGLRYKIGDYVSARFDWGIKLHKKAAYEGGNTMIHFAFTLSY